MTPPIPQNPTSSPAGTTDFDKYEDFILEEYMDMTSENNEQCKSSGPVHPSHFSGISPEDDSLFKRNFRANSETEISRDRKFGHEHQAFNQHDSQGSILQTLTTSRRNNPANSPAYMKTVRESINEETSKLPHKTYDYPNLCKPEECRRFEMLNHSNKEKGTPNIPSTSEFDCNQGLSIQPVQHPPVPLVGMEHEEYSEGSSGSSDEVWAPQVTDTADSRHLSSSKGWNHTQQKIDLSSSSEALADLLAHQIQPIKPEDPYVACQNAQTLQPLTTGTHSYHVGTEEMRLISSHNTVSNTLVFDEWPEIEEQRPSVIVQSPSAAPTECLQYRTAIRTIDPAITGEELQLQQEWPATTSSYPGQQFANFTHAIPWSRENELNGLKYNWPADKRVPSMSTDAWDYHSIQDSSVIDQKSIRTDERRHMDESAQGGSINCQDTNYDGVQSHANRTDQYVSSPSTNQNIEEIAEYTVRPLAHSGNAKWSQPDNYDITMDDGRQQWMTGHNHDDHAIQRLATNFAHLNQPTNPETALAPEREMTSSDTAFQALASIGMFPYPCNDPNCPGDMSRRFQEFPFPRRKSIRGLSNHNPNQISPIPSSSGSGSEGIFSEMFEVDPNQEEQRLLLRRMRNREAAKRCRKKKKQEFIALLFKRAMLLAEYHRCYHTCHQNIPKP